MKIKSIKSLGQVFLVNRKIAEQLVAALEIGVDDVVLEIGPGKGIITARLIEVAREVIAVDIDLRLIQYLSRKLPLQNNLKLIHADFLTFDLANYTHLKIIGNLPYYLSSAILWKLLDNFFSWETAVITVQREFARRITAKPGSTNYCPISVVSQLLCDCRCLFNIPKSYFRPIPSVTSTAVRLKRFASNFSQRDFCLLSSLVRAAFYPQPRKLLINNLLLNIKITRMELVEVFQKLGLPLNIRANALQPADFVRLATALSFCLTVHNNNRVSYGQ